MQEPFLDSIFCSSSLKQLCEVHSSNTTAGTSAEHHVLYYCTDLIKLSCSTEENKKLVGIRTVGLWVLQELYVVKWLKCTLNLYLEQEAAAVFLLRRKLIQLFSLFTLLSALLTDLPPSSTPLSRAFVRFSAPLLHFIGQGFLNISAKH